MKKISLVFVMSVGLTLAIAIAATAQSSQISVGQSTQVSAAFASLSHYENVLAADPKDPGRLLGCAIYNSKMPRMFPYDTVCYLTTDGGRRWAPVIRTRNLQSGDPAVAYGANGRVYYAELHSTVDSDGRQHGHTFVWTSKDGGKTWGSPKKLRQGDREYISVDMSGGRFNGRVYVNEAMTTRSIDDPQEKSGDFKNGFGVLVSDSGSSPFYLKNLLNPVENHYVFADGNGVVMADGTYAVVLPDELSLRPQQPGSPNFAIKFLASTDGGQTFAKAVDIHDANVPMGTGGSINGFGIPPMMAIDTSNGPFRNRLYVVWGEYVGGQARVMMSHSSDRGKTWSDAAIVDDVPDTTMKNGIVTFEANVAVNKNGVVGLTWYDRRDDARGLGWYQRFTVSTDGGETFLPSVRVQTTPYTLYNRPYFTADAASQGGGDRIDYYRSKPLASTIGYNSRYDLSGGDTTGLAADANGTFHSLFLDTRTGVSQLWTAPITVNAHAILNGSPDLSELRDVTKDVTIDFANPQFDLRSGTVAVDAYVANTSNRTLSGPLKARMMTLTSKMGVPSLMTTDNGNHTEGAIVDFTPLLPAGGLAPRQRTEPRRLQFHLNDLRSRSAADAASLTDFVDFTAKIYSNP